LSQVDDHIADCYFGLGAGSVLIRGNLGSTVIGELESGSPAVGGPDITVVMSPRERFSVIQRSIDSLYEDLDEPFAFICVDAGSPSWVRRRLAAESRRRGFRLIRTKHYLTPNEARNIALPEVKTKYVVFIDNDVVFAPGWLSALKRCAEETGADVVSPLICIGEPIHTKIHFAGGAAAITTESGKRIFREMHEFDGRRLSEVRATLSRQSTDLAEFHCMFVNRGIFERLGRLDEHLKSIHEHTDLCLTVRENGGTVMFEPDAVVTYLWEVRLSLSDLPFFFYRWNDKCAQESEIYFHRKWNFAFDDRCTRGFVLPHRRSAASRAREFAQILFGRQISAFLYDKAVQALIQLGRWQRHSAFK
jgi:GT2 family glycosyltransferase